MDCWFILNWQSFFLFESVNHFNIEKQRLHIPWKGINREFFYFFKTCVDKNHVLKLYITGNRIVTTHLRGGHDYLLLI